MLSITNVYLFIHHRANVKAGQRSCSFYRLCPLLLQDAQLVESLGWLPLTAQRLNVMDCVQNAINVISVCWAACDVFCYMDDVDYFYWVLFHLES